MYVRLFFVIGALAHLSSGCTDIAPTTDADTVQVDVPDTTAGDTVQADVPDGTTGDTPPSDAPADVPDCLSGYRDDGGTCVDINECLLAATCGDNASCTNSEGSFACACDAGFEGDGQSCTDIDECADAPCQNGGTCVDGADQFNCVCVGFWTGETCEDAPQGETCSNALPLSVSAASPTVLIVDTTGASDDYTASDQCPGFTDLGPTPGVDVVYELTVDTTADYTFVRTNTTTGATNGSDILYVVSDCSYIGNSCSGLVDFFLGGTGVISLVAGETYFMISDGWDDGTQDSSDPFELTIVVAVNECGDGTDNCGDNATCNDLLVGFECACNIGYEGDGTSCTEIDECDPNPCQNSGVCTDEVDNYSCSCPFGFFGPQCQDACDALFPFTPTGWSSTLSPQIDGAKLVDGIYRGFETVMQFDCAGADAASSFCTDGEVTGGKFVVFHEETTFSSARWMSDWHSKRIKDYRVYVGQAAGPDILVAEGTAPMNPYQCVVGEACTEEVPDDCCVNGRDQPQAFEAPAPLAKWDVVKFPATVGTKIVLEVLSSYSNRANIYELQGGTPLCP